jgi:hypothetical protein
MRKDYLLADVFGCSAKECPPGTVIDYITGKNEKNWLTKGLEQSRIPCPKECRYVVKRSGKALLYYYERLTRRYSLLTRPSKRPAAVFNRFGKGSSLMIPSGVGEYYRWFCFPDFRVVIENAVLAQANPPARVISHKNFVEITVRKNAAGRVLIHLINLTGKDRPIENILPLKDVKVLLGAGFTARNAVSLMTGKKCRVKKGKKGSLIILPSLENYDIIEM